MRCNNQSRYKIRGGGLAALPSKSATSHTLYQKPWNWIHNMQKPSFEHLFAYQMEKKKVVQTN